MSEMIERVAKAMLVKDRAGDYWDVTSEDGDGYGYVGKNEYRAMARAAIEAMRDPTKEMENAFVQQSWKRMNFKLQFRAAINAALS